MNSPSNKKTILVADDHEELCELIASILEFDFPEYNFAIAYSGTDAFTKFLELQPCLALIDMHLNDMSGHTLALKMRAENRNIKIIMVTAYSPNEIAETAALVDAFISKPIFKDKLIADVRRLLLNS